MPHVTFIHGIANKPDPDVLVRIWRDSLARDDGLDLGGEGVTSTMVYWADVLYPEAKAEVPAHESNDTVIAKDDEDVDLAWRHQVDGDEKAWTESFAEKLDLDAPPPEGDEDHTPPRAALEAAAVATFERVPLPWWLKRRIMKALLRDVHHYLFNTESSPRPDATFLVQDEIRRRMTEALAEGAQRPGPHVVMSHSMGTVVAYDCLKRVPGVDPVDALITIGSPLGLDEIQDKLSPGWTRDDGFPANVAQRWINVYDRLDPVAGFDPELANDYRRGGQKVVEDIHEPNHGRWRHNISKYLSGAQLRRALAEVLEL